jgi:hypothetical protein
MEHGRAGSSSSHLSNAPGQQVALGVIEYQPRLPRWTGFGMTWLVVTGLGMALAASLVTVDSHVPVRVSLVEAAAESVVIVHGVLPDDARLAPGVDLRFIADGADMPPRRIRLQRRLDTASGAAPELAGHPAFVIAGQGTGGNVDGSDRTEGVLIVPTGELTLWQHLGRWL